MARRIVDTHDVAKQIRETFYAKKVRREIPLPCKWPSRARYIGQGRAVMYQSDKWGGPDQPWKHIAESEQEVYLTSQTLNSLYDADGNAFSFGPDAEWCEVNGPMPRHMAVLAPSLGLQVTLVTGELREISIPGTYWGATKHPDTGETYLVWYDANAIYALITGEELDVTEDGIVG